MRLCSSEQPAHISLIRRRSRSIVSRAPASSGTYRGSPEPCADIVDEEVEDTVTNLLTAGPSISARDVTVARKARATWSIERAPERDPVRGVVQLSFTDALIERPSFSRRRERGASSASS